MGESECDHGRDDVTEAFDEVIRLMIRHLNDHGGLTFPAITCLGRLYRDGPARLTALAAAVGASQPSTSQLVQRLERQGLVARVRDPQDGRASLIVLSDAGRTLVANRLRERRDRLTELLATLSPEDDASLRLAMQVIRPIVRRLTETARRSEAQAGS
ncbi:MarR family transcriptional regulator [Amycolatopsis rubida]|uniref:MarR family transcriptional regulator n=1 Tax=Amycolatopsis rubida TaxID=112413 RepID=A0ABX0C6D2_9PSEU|nr:MULTISPECIES: MarR family transcriptional regulator [Amycolatopsis]MYW97390.1 MarR family transcriptional regulator [Amycolatopsis rubida]NEC62375.1 MarR family transcriptional regulator [Amycolatopsis rubida]OAP22775.1 MarR family protein [Amycolatopsis sp. M39]